MKESNPILLLWPLFSEPVQALFAEQGSRAALLCNKEGIRQRYICSYSTHRHAFSIRQLTKRSSGVCEDTKQESGLMECNDHGFRSLWPSKGSIFVFP